MMKTRNGLFADVPEELWNDWRWQVRNRIETVEDLKAYLNITPEEEEGIRRCLGTLRMAITPYYLSLIDLDDPHDPIRRHAEVSDVQPHDLLHQRGVPAVALGDLRGAAALLCLLHDRLDLPLEIDGLRQGDGLAPVGNV
jgi:hypothetical protein